MVCTELVGANLNKKYSHCGWIYVSQVLYVFVLNTVVIVVILDATFISLLPARHRLKHLKPIKLHLEDVLVLFTILTTYPSSSHLKIIGIEYKINQLTFKFKHYKARNEL